MLVFVKLAPFVWYSKTSSNGKFMNLWSGSSYNVHLYIVGKRNSLQAEDDVGAYWWTVNWFGG